MRDKYCITDCRISRKCLDGLEHNGYKTISLPPFEKLSYPISSHPDMIINMIGSKIFVHSEYYCRFGTVIDKIASISESSIVLCHDNINAAYPHDILLNTFTIGNYSIGLLKYNALELRNYIQQMGLIELNTRQGYAKCSSCVIDNGVITDDISISNILIAHDIDVLLIEHGNVLLDGYEYGFIGGASGYDRKNKTLYFCGNIKSHPDYEKIYVFCLQHDTKIVQLSSEKLYDVGTLFFI